MLLCIRYVAKCNRNLNAAFVCWRFIMFVEIFSDIDLDSEGIGRHANFRSFPDALLSLFRYQHSSLVRWRLTSTPFDNLLFSMNSKLFARCTLDVTVSIICYHRVSLVVKWYCVLGDIHLMSLVWHETTKRPFLMRCRYREKSVLLGLGCPADA